MRGIDVDYIQVENGEIKGYPRPLPQNWADVSNFYLLEDEHLRQYGWYPLRFVPATKTEMEIKNEIVNSEASILLVADSLLSNGNYTEAKKILKDLKSKESIIELQSNIQLREIEDLFKSIETQINNKEYDSAKNELQLIIWKKNSMELDLEMIEEKYFKRYIQLKTNLNGKLPEENRAQVESELDF